MIRRKLFFNNCKPALTNAVKRVKTIDANKTRIAALKAEKKAILAELASMFNARQAYAQLPLAA